MAGVLASSLEEGNELGEPRLCPVCGSLHHPQIANLIKDVTFDDAISLKKTEEITLENLLKEYQKEQIQLAGLLRDEENLNNQLDITSIKLKDINIEELQGATMSSESSLLHFKEKLEVYNKQKTEIDLSLVKLRNEKSKVDMDEAKFGEGLRKESEALITLQEELSIAMGCLKLLQENFKVLNEELLGEEKLFKQKPNTNEALMSVKEKILQIKVIDNEVIKLTGTARKFRVELVNLEKERVNIDKALRDLGSSKTEIETSGKGKKEEIDRLTLQIVELCGFTPTAKGALVERTPKIEVEKVRNEIKDITLKESSLRDIFERESIEKQNVQTQKLVRKTKKK